jgi:hypothetical protein
VSCGVGSLCSQLLLSTVAAHQDCLGCVRGAAAAAKPSSQAGWLAGWLALSCMQVQLCNKDPGGLHYPSPPPFPSTG